jgi:cytoskeletal protein CcmA (bactofilin family)
MKFRSVVAALFALSFFAALPGVAWAADFRAGDNQDVTGAIDDDVYVAGDGIVVSGDVTGDVFAAGRNVRLSGSAGQSFFAGAQRITISGRVGNSARVAGQDLVVSGEVGKDLLGAGQSVTIEEGGTVGRDVWFGGQTLEVAGNVARDVRGGPADLTISGTVGGNVEVEGNNVTLTESARIAGDLIYTSKNEANIADGAVVSGEVIRRQPKAAPAEESNPVVDAVFSFLRGVAGSFLLGLVLLWLLPDLLPVLARTMRSDTLASAGIGLAALFLIPIVALIILIPALLLGTFGAVPFLMIAVYGFLLMLAKAAVGYLIGLMVLQKTGNPTTAGTLGDSLKALIVGVVLLTLVGLIPFIGGLVGFLTAILALGAGLLAFSRWRKSREATVPPAGPAVTTGAASV